MWCSLLDLATLAVADNGATHFNVFQAVVVGVVQGLTEFLPISSTAHVKMVPLALGWGDPGIAFTAIVQLGSIGSILGYFWADVVAVVRGFQQAIATGNYRSSEFRLGLGIAVGTVPIVVLGLMMKLGFEEAYDTFARSSFTIAITSIGLAVLLGLAEVIGQRKRQFNNLGVGDGVGVGLAQALALIPGVSRSGSTITAALFMGLDRTTAARFSLLLGVPAILISGLVGIGDIFEPEAIPLGWGALLAGILASVVSSYLAIYWLIKFLRDHTTWVFVAYRVGFGAVILWAIATGRLSSF
ncbi:MAG: undecaprenyl-diphosphate phosphatase [Cyanobacteria bacterium P01_H01_bin.119]